MTKYYRRGHDFLLISPEHIIEFRRDFDISPAHGQHYQTTDYTCSYQGIPEQSGWTATTLTSDERAGLSGHNYVI
jgi:hypothetical protein